MLVSKPNSKTLSSLVTFLLLNFGLLFYLIYINIEAEIIPFYQKLLIIILALVGLSIFVKIIVAYKIVTIDKQKIQVKHPLRLGQFKTNLKALIFWQETVIKTNKTLFKEIKMHFELNKTIKITLQENTNYDKVLSFLMRNAPKKRRSEKA